MRKLEYQEILDILVGCTILATGGGGSLKKGIKAIEQVINSGKQVYLMDFNEIKDESMYITPYYCGSNSPDGVETDDEVHNELIYAIESLEDYMNIEFEGIISAEYGGLNTAEAMAVAANMNRCIVDADAVGRAVPEIFYSTYAINNQPIQPFSVATKYKDTAIFTNIDSDARAEKLSRMMAVATEDSVGIADHPITGLKLKNSVIPHALSYAREVGRTQREAKEKGLDAVNELINKFRGKMLFKGFVSNKGTNWEIRDGFTYGTIGFEGCEEYSGDIFSIWYKNENMVAWLNEDPVLTCPDLICTVDLKTGYPVTNPNCNPGDQLAVIGFKAPEMWRTKRGLEIFNPRQFGFDMNVIFLE